jgi:signal transduction histidine kinase
LVELPLRYQDTPVGELQTTARRGGQSLSRAERKVLHDLAQQVGIALYAAQMTADVQRSRTRLVAAREEERRRIRRDLHDGLGPTLASLAMRLEQARDTLPAGAAESAALLAGLTAETQETIADVRRLVYQLRPPDLDEYGLVSAIREYLRRMTPKGTSITFVAPETLPSLPAAVEVAAYRIVQEAVINALRHAHAKAIAVTLALEAGAGAPSALSIQIHDNGQGLSDRPAAEITDGVAPSGIGLHSMRERAEELGGSFALESSAEGGTLVAAYLPLAEKEATEKGATEKKTTEKETTEKETTA